MRHIIRRSGFVLVSTVSISVLMMMVALAMLSLGTIAIRTSATGDAQSRARANARIALMLAIGELQELTGPDTRITANADILVPGAPPLTGVWKSWEGTDHDAGGRPITPDYDEKSLPVSDPETRFLGYLVSGANELTEPAANNLSDLISTTAADDTIPLVSDGSLGPNAGQVHVKPRMLQGNAGGYAWWVSPENQKARIQQPHEPKSDDLPGWVGMMQSHAVPDPEVFGLGDLLDDKETYEPQVGVTKSVRKSATRDSFDLIQPGGAVVPSKHFHDISSSAVGLLTNVATGGWRKDMSILAERSDEIYSQDADGRLPMFRYLPEQNAVSRVPKPSLNDMAPAGSLFYPWSDYPANAGAVNVSHTQMHTRSGASSSWLSLMDYVKSYQYVRFDRNTNTMSTDPTYWPMVRDGYGLSSLEVDNRTAYFNSMHKNRREPVMARMQYVFFARALRPAWTSTDRWRSTAYEIEVIAKPVITFWNPYSVELVIERPMALVWNKTVPMVFALHNETRNPTPYLGDPQDGVTNTPRYFKVHTGTNGFGGYDSLIPINQSRNYQSLFGANDFIFHFPEKITLAPGECQTFSTDQIGANANYVQGVKGYDGSVEGGWKLSYPVGRIGDTANRWYANHRVKMYMRFDHHSRLTSQVGQTGPGFFLQYGVRMMNASGNFVNYVKDYITRYSMLTNEEFAKKYWETPVDLPSFQISDIAIHDANFPGEPVPTSNPPWTPLFSIVLGPRLTVGAGDANPQDHPTKGLLQNNPFVTSQVAANTLEGKNHPSNCHYEFAVHAHEDGGSSTLPEDSTGPGYMVTGYQTGNGLSHLVLSEVPAKPLASLVDLQHWNVQGGKPLPPYQYYVIGNSHASPMIPKDDVVADRNGIAAGPNLIHDDSYCSNHLLFDDWFVSSISPELVDLGNEVRTSMEDVYRQFLKGERYLQNRVYRPCSTFSGLSDDEVDELASDTLETSDGWLKVASQIEVEGMFNVNSTSPKAWKAVLGHARDMDIYHHTRNGIVKGKEDADHVISRTYLPGDEEADPAATGAGGLFPGASEYGGFRSLSDSDLDELANHIVEQVRLRGPFLSLSEFVNRKLSEDDESMMGAVQAALERLSSDPNRFLKSPGYSSATMDPSDPRLVGVDVYENESAAQGFNTYGLPGWITQADVLRPIAPILSARDDTFTIRAYGDARDASGQVTAQAWCEATVVRGRDFVNNADPADSIEPPADDLNQKFGRRYKIVAFRWLSTESI